MASAPQFAGPDGVLRQTYIFTTSVSSRFFNGTMDADTVDMQVSIRGAAFSSDPDLITFEGDTFMVPNPSAFPDGLQLLAGSNEVRVKAILSNGAVTQEATIAASLTEDGEIQNLINPPTGLSIERFDRTVKLAIEGIEDVEFSGMHLYASTEPGGGAVGYFRINPDLLTTGTPTEVLTTIGELEVDQPVLVDSNGFQVADPMFVNYKGTQTDSSGGVLQTDFNESLEISENVTQVRTTMTIESVRLVDLFEFTHDRQASFNSSDNPAIPNASFNTIQSTDPLYYVATATYLVNDQEIESTFSPEVSGSPLVITPTVGTLPQVSRNQIQKDAVLSLFRSQPILPFGPGTVIRDTFLDPFTSEAERIRFVVDFTYRAQTFTLLLQIDDPTFSGDSIPVEQSPYKLALRQALFLASTLDVQLLIDTTFDRLASNYGKTRRAGRRARGEVILYVAFRPTTSITLPVGTVVMGGGARFRLTSAATISAAGAGSFYDPLTGRYSAKAFIQAEEPGENGNLAPNQITTVLNNTLKVQVTNESNTFGGLGSETNRDLANRAISALSSVDSGTLQGITARAVDVPGVSQVNIVDAGHPLMKRDLDDAGVHVGGKVDVWIRGSNTATVTDNFAFSFEVAEGVLFEPVGDIQNLKFRAVDVRLSEDNPIIEMLDIPGYGFEFKNQISGKIYDLTDVLVISYNSIQLSSTYNSPVPMSLTDVITGSYRYRTSSDYTFTRQPASAINSFTGQITGIVTPLVYDLVRTQSPLELGKSNLAGDALKVTQPDLLEDGTTIPSSIPVTVTAESHVMLDGIEYLNFLGGNELSIVITDESGTITYVHPRDPSVSTGTPSDYTFVQGSQTSPLGIRLTSASQILEGQTVLISYQHDENYVVNYDYNALVPIVQNSLDPHNHLTADIVVKEAVQVPVDITATVVLQNSISRNLQLSASTVEGSILTELARLFNALVLGEPLRQSDILDAIEDVQGVSYVVVPLTKLAKSDETLVVREALFVGTVSDYVEITSWSTDTVKVYLFLNRLDGSTTDAGGPTNEYRGVFSDEDRMNHLEQPPNVNGVPIKGAQETAFIIGAAGLFIPGYSDDDTLKVAFPFASDDEIDGKRKELTQNRVLVALPTVDDEADPAARSYTATYIINGDEGVRNIEPGPTEYITLGDVDLSYDEDIDFLARVQGRSI